MEIAGNDMVSKAGELAGGGMASEAGSGREGSRAAGKAKWTFMVYMAGDNNLYGAALRDIAEMARAGSTKDVNILVQIDRIEDNLTRCFRITQISEQMHYAGTKKMLPILHMFHPVFNKVDRMSMV